MTKSDTILFLSAYIQTKLYTEKPNNVIHLLSALLKGYFAIYRAIPKYLKKNNNINPI